MTANRLRDVTAGLAGAGLLFSAVHCSGSPQIGSTRSGDTTQPQLVTTPFGLVNSQCVAEVGASDSVTVSDVPPCATPVLPPQAGAGGGAPPSTGAQQGAAADGGEGAEGSSGAAGEAGVAPAPVFPAATINGWVEYASWTATETPGELATTWHVPAVPQSDVGQTIFFFPSYEPANGSAIVQPVLQYGVSAAGGGSYWAVASWWVGPTGARFSSLLPVNPGDTIRGTITTSNCDANGGCKFVIVTRDETIDNARQLTVFESVPYTWTQAAVLEIYGVSDCSQLPANNVTFSSFVFTDQGGSPLNATWAPEFPVPIRNCNYQVNVAPGESSVSLVY